MWYTLAMGDIFSMYAGLQPAKPAIIEHPPGGDARVLTYAQAERAANRLAHGLAALGVGAGESLAWSGPNSTEVVLLIHAARKIGATAVPVNYRLTDAEAAYVIDHCDASVLYVDAQHAAMVARIRDAIPKVRTVVVYRGEAPTGDGTAGFVAADELTAGRPDEPPNDATPGATMIYTSGTTGKPKGALRAGSLDANYVGAVVAEIGYAPDDVYLTTGPLYHSGPSGFMGIAVELGQTVVLQRNNDPLDW